jgi:hypothetical protein
MWGKEEGDSFIFLVRKEAKIKLKILDDTVLQLWLGE